MTKTPTAQPTNRAGKVEMDVAVVLGRIRVPLDTLLNCTEGSILELRKVSGEAADVEVNGELFAKAEVVTIAENFGVRLVEMIDKKK